MIAKVGGYFGDSYVGLFFGEQSRIAKALGIGQASVYRVLVPGSLIVSAQPPVTDVTATP